MLTQIPIPSHFGARTRFVNKPPACKRRTKRRSRCFHKPPTPVWKTSRFSTFPPRGLVHPSFFVNEKTHKAEDGCELQSRKSCECRRPPLCAPYIKTIIDETPRKARNTRPHNKLPRSKLTGYFIFENRRFSTFR